MCGLCGFLVSVVFVVSAVLRDVLVFKGFGSSLVSVVCVAYGFSWFLGVLWLSWFLSFLSFLRLWWLLGFFGLCGSWFFVVSWSSMVFVVFMFFMVFAVLAACAAFVVS